MRASPGAKGGGPPGSSATAPSARIATAATVAHRLALEPIAVSRSSKRRACYPNRVAAGLDRVRADHRRGRSVRKDLREELLRALGARLAEEVVLRRVLDDVAVGHEDDAI